MEGPTLILGNSSHFYKKVQKEKENTHKDPEKCNKHPELPEEITIGPRAHPKNLDHGVAAVPPAAGKKALLHLVDGRISHPPHSNGIETR